MSENEQTGATHFEPAPAQEDDTTTGLSRRSFLTNAGVLAGSLAVGGMLKSKGNAVFSSRPNVRDSTQVTNIDIWSWYTEDEPVWPSIQKEFHDAYPSMTVTPRTFGTLADYSPVIESSVSAGTAPDIMAPATLAISYGQAGIVADLKKELGTSFLNDFFPSINAEYSLNGKQYAIGWEAQMFGLFYNPDLLAKAKVDFPETWDDLIASVPAFKKIGIIPCCLTGNPSNQASDFFLPLITQASNDPTLCLKLDQLTEPGISWDSKPVIEAFTLMEKLVKADVFEPGVDAVTFDEALAIFYTGKSAMLSFGSFIVPSPWRRRLLRRSTSSTRSGSGPPGQLARRIGAGTRLGPAGRSMPMATWTLPSRS